MYLFFCQIPIKSQTQRTNSKKSTKKSHRKPFNRHAMAFLSVFIRHFLEFSLFVQNVGFFTQSQKQRTNFTVSLTVSFSVSFSTKYVLQSELSRTVSRTFTGTTSGRLSLKFVCYRNYSAISIFKLS